MMLDCSYRRVFISRKCGLANWEIDISVLVGVFSIDCIFHESLRQMNGVSVESQKIFVQ